MSNYDLIIRNGLVVTEEGVTKQDVAVCDGVIVEVLAEIPGNAKETIDASGLHIFPGAFDPHVHFDEPGRTEWECFETGSAALAAGGATLLTDMPLNSIPFTLDKKSFDIKVEAAQKSCLVDYSLWGGLIPGVVDQMEEMADAGVVGFKAFTCFSGLDEYQGCDDYTMYTAMQKAAVLGLPIAVHAENDSITRALWAKAVSEGRLTARDFNESRPAITEIEAIQRMIIFAEDTHCPLHISHVSTARGLELVADAKSRGINVTCETVPYYLVFTAEDVERLGPMAKCGLPPKDIANRANMWKEVLAGSADFVCSDHSPADVARKSGENFFNVWGGIAGCQSTLSTMISDGYFKNGLPLERIPALTAGNAAKRFRLPGKGKIEIGYDGDFALVNLRKSYILKDEDLFYKNKTSPFVGHQFQGTVERTILRGTTIFKDGKVVSEPIGKLLKPIR